MPLRLASLALALAFAGCGEPSPRAATPAVATLRLDAWTNDACGACHESERAQLAQSAHGRGLDNPRFVTEWRRERLRFCSDCHAPLGPPGSTGAAQAVGCAVCHAEATRGAETSTGAPHALGTGEARDRTLCAPCHDFSFPDARQAPRSAFDPRGALQSTWREWARSEAAARGEGCIGCHMPGGDHTLVLRRDPSAPVLQVAHRWLEHGVVELRLEATDAVGHALPTGDVFRTLGVELRLPGGSPIARTRLRRVLTGHRHVDGVVRIRESLDSRVPPPGNGPSVVRLRVGGAPRPLELRVTLHRTPRAEGEGVRELFRGLLAP